MAKNYKQEIDLSKLPRWKTGRHEGKINWEKSVGYKLDFIYDDITGYVTIINYVKTNKVEINYNNKNVIINTVRLSKCELGNILGKITSEFKVEIGTIFKNDKRDIIVTDKKYIQQEKIDKKGRKSIANRKYYKYTCNICGWTEGWIDESGLIGNKEQGCSCCSGHNAVEGINDIPTVASFMIGYFQGGYDEAKLYTKRGYGNKNNKGGYIHPICPNCGRRKSTKMSIDTIYTHNSIGCSCSDKIPYGEKIMFNVLEQLGLDFRTQLNKATFKWCQDYRYDFYFSSNREDILTETHGNQHYKDCTGNWKIKLEEQLAIDKAKKELALSNGIKPTNYITIDCRESSLKWIKEHILDSRLNELFDLSKIDWIKVEEFACSTRVKEACDYKNSNPNLTTTEIGKLMNMGKCAITKFLKKGNEIGWCIYNTEKEFNKTLFKKGQKPMYAKSVVILKDNIILYDYIFESIIDLKRQSEKLFGIKLLQGRISKACKSGEQYKGYTFKYTSDLTPEEISQIQQQSILNQAI